MNDGINHCLHLELKTNENTKSFQLSLKPGLVGFPKTWACGMYFSNTCYVLKINEVIQSLVNNAYKTESVYP